MREVSPRSMLLIGWMLFFWGLFSPMIIVNAVQYILAIGCFGIGLGMSLERMWKGDL